MAAPPKATVCTLYPCRLRRSACSFPPPPRSSTQLAGLTRHLSPQAIVSPVITEVSGVRLTSDERTPYLLTTYRVVLSPPSAESIPSASAGKEWQSFFALSHPALTSHSGGKNRFLPPIQKRPSSPMHCRTSSHIARRRR